jgi:alkylhydroperoxidase family enzyme
MTTFTARLDELRDRVTAGPGQLSVAVRSAAASGGSVPEEAQAYVDKVRRHAYKVVDRDVEDLKAAGWSEDEIFELTVATAVDAGASRWERARRLLEEARR